MSKDNPEKGTQNALSIVEDVLDLPRSDRAGALLRACGDDPQLLEEALGLAWASLEASAVDTPAFVPLRRPQPVSSASLDSVGASEDGVREDGSDAVGDTDTVGDRWIGPFRVLRELGHGGMGTVYLAEQREPIQRRVAIKVAREWLDERARVRLAAERQAMARLSHPNVAQLYEAGATPDGHPYFAMEHVEGDRLTEHCDHLRLGIDERLRLFLEVCDGVEHAHRHGILHRDLKPSNILVAADDSRPKVIDFGIAKAIDGRLHDGTFLTGQGLVGTPAYLSPEAITDPDSVDTGSDVYSLGVVLQELLIGVRLVPEVEGESAIALLHRIHKADPPPILRRWRDLGADDRRRVLAARDLEAGDLEAKLRGDLEWIVGCATARSKEGRYDAVAQLAADVRRHLEHQPVLASPPSALYQLRKLVRRHRVTFAFSVVLLLSLIGGFVARTLEADRARRLAADAIQAREETQEVVDYLTDLFGAANPHESLGDDPTATQLLDRGVERLQGEAFDERPAIRARLLHTTARVLWRLGRVERSQRLAEEALEIRSRVAPGSAELAESLRFVGVLAGRADDHERAEALLREALALREATNGPNSLEASGVLVDLAVVLEESERAEEALPIAQRALEIEESELGPQDPRVLGILNNLAILSQRAGRIDEAEQAYRRALDGKRKTLPPNHPHLALTLVNLGNLLTEHRRTEEAIPLFEEARAIEEQVLGPDHPDLALTLSSLGAALRNEGQWDAAQQTFERSLAILEEARGPEHAHVGILLFNLGRLAEARGDLAAAKEQHDRAVRIREKGTWVFARIESLLHLAKVERLRGDRAASSLLLGRAQELMDDEEPGSSQERFLAAERGWLALEAGETEAAESHFRKATEGEATSEQAAEAQGEAWKGWARLALARGATREAGAAARRSLEAFETVFAPAHAAVEEARALVEEIDRES